MNDMAKALSRKVTIYINGKEVENTIRSLQTELRRLQNEQKKATIGSEEYLDRGAEIAKLKKYLQDHDATVQKIGTTWEGTAAEIAKYTAYSANTVWVAALHVQWRVTPAAR